MPPTSQTELVTDLDGTLLAIIIRGDYVPDATEFLTDRSAVQQVGLIRRAAGATIARHDHPPVERTIKGTPETLVVRTGHIRVTLYRGRRDPVTTRDLVGGDAIVLLSGGHGFELIEDTVLLEVKQGPYVGEADKERF